jgi:hypothetical protein
MGMEFRIQDYVGQYLHGREEPISSTLFSNMNVQRLCIEEVAMCRSQSSLKVHGSRSSCGVALWLVIPTRRHFVAPSTSRGRELHPVADDCFLDLNDENTQIAQDNTFLHCSFKTPNEISASHSPQCFSTKTPRQ